MEIIWIILSIIVISGIGVAIGSVFQVAGKQNAFRMLGDMTGKSFSEIVSLAGPPQSISAHPDGKLAQWIFTNQAGGYHIGILFDHNDVFVGITHETTV